MRQNPNIRLTKVDREEAREAHTLAFPHDLWCGDDCDYWLAKCGRLVLGFLAVFVDDRGVYISRVAVVKCEWGGGLGRRLVRFALRYGRKCGYANAYTYTLPKNYESMCMLLKCGFRFVRPPKSGQYMGKQRVHYFARQL